MKKGTINDIVAFKMDRLTRSVFDVEKLMAVVNNAGCDIDCLNDSLNNYYLYWKINFKNYDKCVSK